MLILAEWTNEAPDPVHLTLLQQGIDSWNQWRLHNQEITPSFHKAQFQGVDLAKADFRKAEFKEADLKKANLEGANFTKANLSKADLRGSNLSGAFLEEANLSDADLSGADLSGAHLNKANLSNAKLISAQLIGSGLADATCGRANFSEANLCRIGAHRANFSGALFLKANLSGAILFSTHFDGADFNQAILCKARFEGAHLSGATLINADLCEANFSWADLSNANLTGACLSRANLTWTRALAANFSEANLDEACIEDWHINSSTNLSKVACKCVYLKANQQERYPHDGDFILGEFSKRFQVLKNIFELSFRNGISWKALALAFNESNIRVFNDFGDELFLQEYKVLGDGLVTLKIIYPLQANGIKIRDELECRTHELELQIARLEGEVRSKDSTITTLFERLLQPKFNAHQSRRIYIDDIDSFARVKDVSFDVISHLLNSKGHLNVSEDKIQIVLEVILNEKFHKKDWGGEYNDLYTSNLIVGGVRRSTAFLLKGNGLQVANMEIKHCGKNGDQLLRLFESPAELFVIQYVGNISEAIVKDVEGKTDQLRSRGKQAYYCIINGLDTARLLYAYSLVNPD
ncbi:pentapeptide repeat-containing protein [Leptolyngbyaceae cyanobacterium UHCC 1019]